MVVTSHPATSPASGGLPPIGAHQDRAINAGLDAESLLIEYGTGCIAGDTSIAINRGGKGWTLRLAELVRKFNGVEDIHPWDLDIPTYVQREQDGVVRLARLQGAWSSGVKQTYQVRTHTGRVIRATAEHPFLTERGWLRLEELEIGDLVHVRGAQAAAGRGPKPRYTDIYRMSAHPYATRHERKDRPNDSYTMTRHRLVAEARLNGLNYPDFLEQVRAGNVSGFQFLDPQMYDVHHLDRDTKNDDPDNLEVHTNSGHPRLHAEEGTYKNVLFKIATERVVSVEPYAEEVTYDLEVADSPHNFLANGFVVHNTGKTRIIVEMIVAILMAGEMPILVAVPNSLIEQTVEEFEKWAGEDWVVKHLLVLNSTYSIEDRRHHLRFGRYNVYLISHEAMSYPQIREALAARKWAATFIDEASRFRNYSNRTKALNILGSRSATRYALTGNLAPRAPTDVWYVMNWLKPAVFGTRNIQTFKSSYCIMGGFENRQALGLRPEKIAEFRAIMDAHRISCELRDVRDLPKRVLHVSRVNMPTKAREAYRELQETLRLEIERVDDITFQSMVKTYATRLQRLQEITSGFARNIDGDVVGLPCAKTTAMLDLLEDEPNTPTVLWYWWRPEFDTLVASLRKHKIPFLRFGEPKAVERFMSGECNVFVSQLAKGGYGLNLTRATRMIYHSLPWSLDVYLQSQERNMRLTTTADHLEIVHLVTRDSVDEYVRHKLLERADISQQMTKSQALELLRS